MDRYLFELSRIFDKGRGIILKCLRETARLHHMELEPLTISIFNEALEREALEEEKRLQKEALEEDKRRFQEVLEEEKRRSKEARDKKALFERLNKRIRKVGLQNYIDKAEGAKSSSEKEKIAVKAMSWAIDPKLYTKKFAEKVFNTMKKYSPSGRISTTLAFGFLVNNEPISDVTKVLFTDPPAPNAIRNLHTWGEMIGRGSLKVENPKQKAEVIADALLQNALQHLD